MYEFTVTCHFKFSASSSGVRMPHPKREMTDVHQEGLQNQD